MNKFGIGMELLGDKELKPIQKAIRINLTLNQLKTSKEKEIKKIERNLAPLATFTSHVQRLYFMRKKYRDWVTLVIFKKILYPEWSDGLNYNFCNQICSVSHALRISREALTIPPTEVTRTIIPSGILLLSSIRIKYNEFLKDHVRNANGDIEVPEPRFFFIALVQQILSAIPKEYQPEYCKSLQALDTVLNAYFSIDDSNIQKDEEMAIRTDLKKYVDTLKEKDEDKKKLIEMMAKKLIIVLRIRGMFKAFPLLQILPLLSFNTISPAILKQKEILNPICSDWSTHKQGSSRFEVTLDQKHGTHVNIRVLPDEGLLSISRIRKYTIEREVAVGVQDTGTAKLSVYAKKAIASFTSSWETPISFKNSTEEIQGRFLFVNIKFEKEAELSDLEFFVEKMVELAEKQTSDPLIDR